MKNLIEWRGYDDYLEGYLGPHHVATVSGDADDEEWTAIAAIHSCLRGDDKHYDSHDRKGMTAAKQFVEQYVAAWIAEAGLVFKEAADV